MTLRAAHLEGRPFYWGSTDCFGLTRSFFDDNFGIEIANYARPTNWDADKLDIIEQLATREGFVKIANWSLADLRPADVMAMAVGSSAPNHLAVYLGGNEIIHHLARRRSRIEAYKPFWPVCFLLRHPDVPDLRPVHPDVSIQELLNARYDRIKA